MQKGIYTVSASKADGIYVYRTHSLALAEGKAGELVQPGVIVTIWRGNVGSNVIAQYIKEGN